MFEAFFDTFANFHSFRNSHKIRNFPALGPPKMFAIIRNFCNSRNFRKIRSSHCDPLSCLWLFWYVCKFLLFS